VVGKKKKKKQEKKKKKKNLRITVISIREARQQQVECEKIVM
jgi:hypothetical protein